MTANEKTLANFETRLRQMILRFQELKQENLDLQALVEKKSQEVKDLEARLSQAGSDYDSLKTAKMMAITDGDLEAAKARISRMIRDVNKCIAILSNEQ